MPTPLPSKRLHELVGRLDLSLDPPICLACLAFVAHELESSPQALTGAARRIAQEMWHEGLAEVARRALLPLADRDEADACAALADLEERRGRSVVARAIVIRLARLLDEDARRHAALVRRARERAEGVVPELN